MQCSPQRQVTWQVLPSARRSFSLRLRALWCLALISLLLSGPLQADQSGWPPRPLAALQAEPVAFARADLDTLREGSEFHFTLPGDGIVLASGQVLTVIHGRITHDDRYINNDRVLRGEGVNQDISVVLTLGQNALFADLGIGDERWVLAAEGEHTLNGWFYQPTGSLGAGAENDFVIPQYDHKQPRKAEPLTLPGAVSDNRSVVESQAGLQITQRFSQDVVTLGETAEIEVIVEFRNQGSNTVSGLDPDIYFILEDAALVSAPACRQRTSQGAQPILSCELDGPLAPGGSGSFSYIVRVGPRAEVGRVVSTVLLDDIRSDAYINVVNDVVGGGSSDSISPFNQRLAEQSNIDRLGNVVIDVMVLYTPDAQSVYGIHTVTRINQLISVANQIYHNSGIGITLRPVHHGRVEYPASQADMHTMLRQLTYGEHAAFANVAVLRERYGADMVVVFRPLSAQTNLCGLANLGGYRTNGDLTAFDDRDYAYSLAAIDCPVSSVLAHELGHNMGLTHSHREDGGGGTFSFATGHGVDHTFATVMANPKAFNASQRIPLFSSPDLDCAGLPCGVRHEDPEYGADAVRTLNLVRYQVADFMPTRVADRAGRRVGAFDGSPSAAYIGISATTDKGLSNADSVALSQSMDISAEFYIDPSHIGQRGHFHVLADLSSAGLGFVQLNDRGEVFEWDGDVEKLVAFNTAEPLNAVEYLRILNDFKPLPEMAGTPIVVFVAYRLIESGELIYTLEPMVVDVRSTP
ncbi:MAG: reprolysin-like metallopeptidase [Pseudohongiella sp.]